MEEAKDNMDIEINYANPQDHIPKAERNNHVIKECITVAYHCLPYNKL